MLVTAVCGVLEHVESLTVHVASNTVSMPTHIKPNKPTIGSLWQLKKAPYTSVSSIRINLFNGKTIGLFCSRILTDYDQTKE